jgi:hypothetical protein
MLSLLYAHARVLFTVQAIKVYATNVYSNMGNYKGHGDIKFVPRCNVGEMEKFLRSTEAWKRAPELEKLWASVKGPMYSLEPGTEYLGFKGKVKAKEWNLLQICMNRVLVASVFRLDSVTFRN